MQIAVIWHALPEAVDPPKTGGHDDPPLCARGRRQAEQTARVLRLALPEGSTRRPVVLHSPALRARETAEIIGLHLDADLVLEDSALDERTWVSEQEADDWGFHHARRFLEDDGTTRILVTHREPLQCLARTLPVLYGGREPIVGDRLKPLLAPGRGFYLASGLPTHVSIRPNA